MMFVFLFLGCEQKRTLKDKPIGQLVQSVSLVKPYVIRQYHSDYQPLALARDVGIVGDEQSVVLNLGFDFTFYQKTYQQISISTNGVLSVGGGKTSYDNLALPDDMAFPNLIAPWWDDLMVESVGQVSYVQLGLAPYRQFVVQYDRVMSVQGHNYYSFQVHLFEQGSRIEFHYGPYEGSLDNSASVGIQDDSNPRQGVNALDCSPFCRMFDFPQNRVIALFPPQAGFIVREQQDNYVPLVGAHSVGIVGDDDAKMVDIGFEMLFDGQKFTQVAVSTNGTLSFDVANRAYMNTDPMTTPVSYLNMLAPWFDDLWVDREEDVVYQTTGTAPNRVFAVQWSHLRHVATYIPETGLYEDDRYVREMQVRFYEQDYRITFHYGRSTSGYEPTSIPGISKLAPKRDTATVGIFAYENPFTIKMCSPFCTEGLLGSFQENTMFTIEEDSVFPTWTFLYDNYFSPVSSAGHCGSCHQEFNLNLTDLHHAFMYQTSIQAHDPNQPGYPLYSPSFDIPVEFFKFLPDGRVDPKSPITMPFYSPLSWMSEPKGACLMPFDECDAAGRVGHESLGNDEAKSRIKRFVFNGAPQNP